jgi:dihydrofolate reductase
MKAIPPTHLKETLMGKLTATSFITLDNVVEDPHLWSGDYFSDETGRLNDEVLRPAGAMVLGRTTYEGFAAAWPSRSGDTFSDKFNSMPKYVVSTTLESADWNNTTILSSDPFARIRELKADQDLITWGSPSLVQGMLEEDLVDELVLLYSPIVLGKGKRLFGAGSRHNLKVTESRPLEGGMLALRLEADRSA